MLNHQNKNSLTAVFLVAGVGFEPLMTAHSLTLIKWSLVQLNTFRKIKNEVHLLRFLWLFIALFEPLMTARSRCSLSGHWFFDCCLTTKIKTALRLFLWLRELDLNQRPSGYEPDELPSCSIPRYVYIICSLVPFVNRNLKINQKKPYYKAIFR